MEPTPDRREGDLGRQLALLLRAYQCAVAEAVDELPHGPRGYQVLGAVVHDDQPTQLALAASLGIDRTVMTYLIDDLVAAGLVERRQSPTDRRARKVVATPLGERRLRGTEERVSRAEEHVLRTLATDERTVFRGLLHRVACETPAEGVDMCEVAGEALTPAR